ncbi:MAG: DUF2178 domain-containing protein [Luteibacter sp.]
MSALVVVFGVYFSVVAWQEQDPAALGIGVRLATLAAALSSLAVVAGIAHLINHLRRVHDEPAQEDERDRLIEARSSALAYYVLMAGMLIVGCVMPFGAKAWEIVHAALLAVAVSEVVHYGAIILGYRKGWRV